MVWFYQYPCVSYHYYLLLYYSAFPVVPDIAFTQTVLPGKHISRLDEAHNLSIKRIKDCRIEAGIGCHQKEGAVDQRSAGQTIGNILSPITVLAAG